MDQGRVGPRRVAMLPGAPGPTAEDGARLSAVELSKVQGMSARPAKEEARQSGVSHLTHGTRNS